MDIPALTLTLELASLTTLLLLLLGTPLALWLAAGHTRPRAQSHPITWLRWAVQAAVALPLVLPPTVLGFYLLVGLGPATALGRTVTTLLGHTLAFSFMGLLVGSMLYSLPFAVQPLAAGFAAVDPVLLETARVLGASPWKLLLRVLLPLARRSLVTAAVLTFAHTVGEFGVVLMVGGDIPGLTRTLSISIYDQVQELNYSAANHTALALVGVSFAALLVVYAQGSWGARGAAHD